MNSRVDLTIDRDFDRKSNKVSEIISPYEKKEDHSFFITSNFFFNSKGKPWGYKSRLHNELKYFKEEIGKEVICQKCGTRILPWNSTNIICKQCKEDLEQEFQHTWRTNKEMI